MQYSNGLIVSTVTVAFLMSGCVKPATQTTTGTTTNNETVVYETATGGTYQPGTVYESAPIVYEDPAAASGTSTTVATEINTGGYTPTTTVYDDANGAYGAPSSGGGDADPYSSGTTTGGTYTPTDYSVNTGYVNNPVPTGGIQLQVAALKSHSAAESFKNSLSLDPKYSAYVQQGGDMNRVIVTGFASRSEALALKERQFPSAFIVSGSAAPAVSTPTYSGGTGSTNSGVGVQVGAFSSQSAALAAAESAAMGRYQAVVKQGTVGGKTIYKAILLGFSSSSDARNAIATGQFGNAFVTTYP